MTTAYRTQFEEFLTEAGRDPAWLSPIRRSALDRFDRLGFPGPKNEDWKFTSTAPIAQTAFRPAPAPASGGLTHADIEPFLMDQANWPRLVFVNGRFQPWLSRVEGLPAGVRCLPLEQALAQDAATVERYLGRQADTEIDAFAALNTAFLREGLFLYVPAEVKITNPVHVLFVADREAGDAVMFPRNLIVLEHHAQAAVLESYVSLGERRYFTNAVTEAVVADGARLDHWKVQRESEEAYHVGTVEVRQGRDSHLGSFSFALGAALSRTNIYTVLGGEGSHCTLNGLYVSHGRQQVDHQTRVEHAEPNCTSHEVYKGILDGHSHAAFNGKVYVRPEAQKTDGKQTNMNLLLSETAKVDTKPQLEIFADDVKCTHGATVGRLDETALFYLKSRALPAAEARKILTYAFAADVIEEIPCRPVAEALEALIRERLGAADLGR